MKQSSPAVLCSDLAILSCMNSKGILFTLQKMTTARDGWDIKSAKTLRFDILVSPSFSCWWSVIFNVWHLQIRALSCGNFCCQICRLTLSVFLQRSHLSIGKNFSKTFVILIGCLCVSYCLHCQCHLWNDAEFDRTPGVIDIYDLLSQVIAIRCG